MVDPTLPLPGLSPVAGKPVIGRFDGGRLSSDGGLLVLREVEKRLQVAERLAACIVDPRDPLRTVHSLADIIGFRLLAIAAGYEDGNDADSLRSDPLFKMALERLPSARDLCSQSTVSRLENLPDARALLRMGHALVDLYCASFRHVPKRIVLDVDDTFDTVHGGQQLRLFNAHYDEYGFQPIVVFDGDGRFVTAVLRPAKRPKGTEIRAFLRRLLRGIRANWPNTDILLRADGHYACPEVLDWCEAEGLDYVLGLPTSRTLRRHVTTLEASTAARFQAVPGADKVRRFKEFYDGASTWSRVRRIVARVEAGAQGTDTRFIVTNLRHGTGRGLYEGLYCARGQAENHIKAWKAHLAADRTSCTRATANQFRLFLHAGAYWLLWSLRAVMPKRSRWRVIQFDTLRLRLVKIAARIVEMKTQIKVHLPTSAPDQAIIHLALGRLPRLTS
ncbi:IS1380 family transposase [Roseomonas genomospecies 6]|uniref:IS1380 family transposase n=1 Tax=Roseomonas genomospecies 6 TaxID=214106 RepID=A0A9W7NDN5_9PROT|nr:IS1380 family transposase [Roseomonas genomospecies 6]KAA0675622.1 IS1380 family transposase [Roseomonas genomospecies 6]